MSLWKKKDECLENKAYQRYPNKSTYRNGYCERDYTTKVVTFSSLSAYYITNKSLDKIKADKLIAQTVPLSLVFMIILAILVNVLV